MAVEIAPRITVDPETRFGKAVIAGTRVPVDLILAKISGGMTMAEVADECDLEQADIFAALAYAAKVVADEEIRLVA